MTHPQNRAVVVDDDTLLCKFFDQQLQNSGMVSYCAHTGQDGLRVVREQMPDIVLLDLHLPDMDGFEICRLLKDDPRTAGIPIMFITASADAYIEAFQAGAADCVTKPIRGLELQARVQRALKHGSIVTSTSPAGDALACAEASISDKQERRTTRAMVEVNRVLGIVGHELRTPLAGLRVMSEYLLCDVTSKEKPHAFLQAIHDETIRLSNLVNNLLESARINSGRAHWCWGDVDVKAACDAAINLIMPLADPNIRFVCDVQPESISMRGDEDAIQRLLINLLTNAHKHTTQGVISIHARQSCDVKGDWVDLSVADTGSGMTPQVVEKLGVPFALNGGVTSDAVSTGLGWFICMSIASAHGGTLDIDSTLGKGTVVSARLRRDLEQAAAEDPEHMSLEVAA